MSKVKKENVTRMHIVTAIHSHIGFSKQISSGIVDAFFERLKESLLAEKDVMISQFGRFSVKKKAARMGRNPKSSECVEIAQRCMVSFKPSKLLRDKINSGL